MKYLIITVAGTSSRFNKDTNYETLKCLYSDEDYRYTLLYQLFENCGEYDSYIIVGGFLFEQLEQFVKDKLTNFSNKIELVFNPHFKDFGSGYSLFKGIEAVKEHGDVTFVEGDLFFSKENFQQVYMCGKNVLSINQEPILANKAVALYISTDGRPHYLYDTNHNSLSIPEPFVAVYNSAQIWKFTSSELLIKVVNQLSEKQIQGTNLEIIQAYFDKLTNNDYEVVIFDKWFNCNTVADYNIVRNLMH